MRIILSCFLLLAALPLKAMELKPDELRGQNKKKPVSVLQNRFFEKSFRPEVGFMVGSFLNEAYTDTTLTGFRSGLFFSEWIGAEVQYGKTSVDDTEDRKALNNLKYRDLEEDRVVTPDPEVNPIYSVMDANVIVAPFYGKLNFFDQFIIYSDLYMTAGGSRVETSQGELTALNYGIGQRFYLLKSMSLRLDFRNRSFNEIRNGSESRRNAMSIDLGASYFFL